MAVYIATLGFLVTLVSAQDHNIQIVSDHTFCPTETTPRDQSPLNKLTTNCSTLVQYAQSPMLTTNDSNVTLIFEPGHHALDSRLHIHNVNNLVLQVRPTNSSSNSVAMVTCTNYVGFVFVNIPEVTVSGLEFRGCWENSVRSVDQLRIEDCTFQDGHGMELRNVRNGTFERSSFTNLIAFSYLLLTELEVTSGGAIAAFDSDVFVTGCLFEGNNADGFGGAISLESGNINIHGSNFSSNAAVFGGAIYAHNGAVIDIILANLSIVTILRSRLIGSISITSSNFNSNTAEIGGGILTVKMGIISIDSSNFSGNKADMGGAVFILGGMNAINNSIFNSNHAERGGAIYIYHTTLNTNGFLQITNNSATTGVVCAAYSRVLLSGNTTISHNTASFYTYASNITLDGHADITNNSHKHDSSSPKEGGAVTAFFSEIVFAGIVTITYNLMEYNYGGAVLLYESKIYTYGETMITHNTAMSGGGIYAFLSELNFDGKTTISENVATMKGGGIHAVSSTIKLTEGELELIENRAEKGGGIHLEQNAKLFVLNYLGTSELNFINNSASYGGALYISDDTNSLDTCKAGECSIQFFSLFRFDISFQEQTTKSYLLVNNSANVSGGTIFGGLLDRCTRAVSSYIDLIRNSEINTPPLQALTIINNLKTNDIQSEISSEPVRVCFCVNGQPNCDYTPPTLNKRKGENFSVSLVAEDQVKNSISSSVRAYLSSNRGLLAEGQIIQKTTSNCTQLNYTITSPLDEEQLVLYAEGPCNDIGISAARVNVTFLPCNCPIGFNKTAEISNCSCECDPCLSEYIVGCSIRNSSVQRRDNIWISYINETDGLEDEQNECPYLTYPHCPFDYCYPSNWINLDTRNGSDTQCAFNRSGKLCGSCKDSLSLSLGSSHCRQCSNYWLALLVVFAVAGVALVAFLLTFNLTVAVGTVNGLILYANILIINRATFFPFQSPISNFITIFIAWLNLDFGFTTCFYDGLDGYAKEWLQLTFPIYIIFLVAMVIIGCEYSTTIARLFIGTNPVATLATLILLSYTKSLRVIIHAFSFATLEYPDGSREKVWLIDANVLFLEQKHIPLFLVALLILLLGIVYTTFLFSYQWLLCCPNKAVKLIKNARFYPFMDAYLTPYNLKHRYWTGLLLFARSIVYSESVAAIIFDGDPSNDLLLIICTMICLLLLKLSLPGRIYKSWPLDALENSFIVNITVLCAGSLYIQERNLGNESQLALTYTSTGIAFITFLAILVYHTYAFKLSRKTQNKLNSFKAKLKAHFTKEEDNDPEIIHILRNVVTYSVVDAIPSQQTLTQNTQNVGASDSEREKATELENKANAIMELSHPSDFSATSTNENASSSEQVASKTEKEIVDNTGMDKTERQNEQVYIELEPRPSKFTDIPYIRDSDVVGMERETEINDFLQVTQ